MTNCKICNHERLRVHDHVRCRFAAYDFSFQVETDVRFIGDWGTFMNAALNIAIATEAADSTLLPPGSWATEAVPADAEPASVEQPESVDGLPDLLNFVPIAKSDKWGGTAINITEEKYESLFMFWGGSRKLFDIMHEWSRKGKAMYYEGFMPTVAGNEHLKMLWMSHPVYVSDHKESAGDITYHCCMAGANDVYNDWFLNRHCMHPGLMHPVKLSGTHWQANNYNKWIKTSGAI